MPCLSSTPMLIWAINLPLVHIPQGHVNLQIWASTFCFPSILWFSICSFTKCIFNLFFQLLGNSQCWQPLLFWKAGELVFSAACSIWGVFSVKSGLNKFIIRSLFYKRRKRPHGPTLPHVRSQILRSQIVIQNQAAAHFLRSLSPLPGSSDR